VSVTEHDHLDDAPDLPDHPPGGSHTTRWVALAVGAVCLGLIALFAVQGGNRIDPPSRLLGQRVPTVAGPSVIDGDHYDIDDARGRWVVVNFFASWCPPCIAEQPELRAFADWGGQTGRAELVGVVFQDPDARRFLVENGGTWPVIDDPAIPVQFQVANVPESFLVAPSGVVVQRMQGELTADDLIGLIDAYETDADDTAGADGADADDADADDADTAGADDAGAGS
jgi:cytochrome c biogenesis protein CcmG, thiol:disulfide interchange protein DsbE